MTWRSPNASKRCRRSASARPTSSARLARSCARRKPATSPDRMSSSTAGHFPARSKRISSSQNQNPKETAMKLVRYGAAGREKPGLIDAKGGIRDLSKVIPDISGDALSPGGLAKLKKLNPEKLPLVKGKQRLRPCVGKVGNFIAIGLNYSDHAAEAGMPIPKEPIIFNKAPSCICGPNDDTITPKGSTKLDYEIELGVVIGSRARYLSKSNAMDAV